MPDFKFKVQGSKNAVPNVGIVTAEDEDAAMEQLEKTYGTERIAINFIDNREFARIQSKKGKHLTHHINQEGAK